MTDATKAYVPPAARSVAPSALRRLTRQPSLVTFLLLVLLVLGFAIATPNHSFATLPVLQLFQTYAPEIALMTMGMSILLIVGEIDLSISSIYVFASVIFATLNHSFGLPLWLCLIAALGAGLVMGAINGLLVAFTGVSSLIITLGTMWGFNAVMNLAIGGKSVPLTDADPNGGLQWILTGQVYGVRMQFVWMIVIAVLLWLFLHRTRTGNRIFATGSNERAARMMGVSVTWTRVLCFCLLAVLAALAGVLAVSRTSVAVPQSGQFTMLLALAGAVVGGTKLTGGSGELFGALCGAFILQVLSLGFIQLGLNDYWVTLVTACAIVLTAFAYLRIDRQLKR
jgi:ribose/xylose/arabinose/galactoside ABC-type transport system permease subunit